MFVHANIPHQGITPYFLQTSSESTEFEIDKSAPICFHSVVEVKLQTRRLSGTQGQIDGDPGNLHRGAGRG